MLIRGLEEFFGAKEWVFARKRLHTSYGPAEHEFYSVKLLHNQFNHYRKRLVESLLRIRHFWRFLNFCANYLTFTINLWSLCAHFKLGLAFRIVSASEKSQKSELKSFLIEPWQNTFKFLISLLLLINLKYGPTKLQLIKTKKASRMKRPFVCKKTGCNKSYTTRFSLRRHVTSHSSIKQHVCVLCFKSFTLAQYLKEHTYIHTG